MDEPKQPAAPVAPVAVAKWRYVVPNAVTSASLVIGLMVMLAASQGRFEAAGWLIVACVLLDKLDGTFARLLGATSKFGVQLDSLTDLVVFGVAPAAVILLTIQGTPELAESWAPWSWAMYASLALFVVCANLRLAKFNVMAESGGPAIFFGMPTTLAGGLLGLFLLIGLQYEFDGLLRALPLIALLFAAMMVSNLPLPKVGKRASTAGNVFQAVNLVLCYICGFVRIFPEYLLLVTLGYAGAGFIWGLLHRSELREQLTGEGDESELAATGA
ncbi:CDP-alcohol phosphatidyltransferase family protein [Pseudenhygromyxa sp. WMMC2535]|uniref:CDP-alcohol phosphatidyltransferase family protein n=1 Tax=Pseudenhygromyxa sp. WMMC2535 TaxID=2712867 RepID=UPI001553BBCA|nr:CDP-alcohol phosphatidyltransferase family protein [Pseudenhygromyxa sp. WMMC2535]